MVQRAGHVKTIFYYGDPMICNDPAYADINAAQRAAARDLHSMDAPELIPAGCWISEGDDNIRARGFCNTLERYVYRE